MGQHCWYAHTVEGRPEEDWQELAAHLTATSDLAAGFAAPFASTEWGRLAGLWHDVGKYRPEFQKRLTGDQSGCSTDHCGLSEGQRCDTAPSHTGLNAALLVQCQTLFAMICTSAI